MTTPDHVVSSGNVFADLQIADAEDMLVKAELAQKIGAILRKRRLTQVQAASVLGVDQPKVSALLCGRLSRFSIEKLMQFLLLLGRDVAITIKPSQRVPPKFRAETLGSEAMSPKRGRLTVDEVRIAKAS
jgi:predicted XRE-type DNA-binding protein